MMDDGTRKSGKGKINKPKKPKELYAGELLKKGWLLKIQVKKNKWKYVNQELNLSAEFITELAGLYESTKIVSCPTPKGDRWKLLQKELGQEYKYAKLLAPALRMEEKDVNDSDLLHEERRARKLSVCRAIKGLNRWSGSEDALLVRFARSGEVEWKSEKAKKQDMQEAPDLILDDLDASMSDPNAKQLENIRRIGKAFGYYLPEKADDERRMELFKQIWDEVRKRGWNEEITLDLKPDVIDTLEKLRSEWSENPNRLHVIIASCPKNVGGIKAAYHALSLHPVGIEDLPDDTADLEKICNALVMPVDRVACTVTKYMYPLSECVKPFISGGNAEMFWCLLYCALDFWDSNTYKGMKLKLRDQLFFRVNKRDKYSLFKDNFVNENGPGNSELDLELALDPKKNFEYNKKMTEEKKNKEKEAWKWLDEVNIWSDKR